MSVRAAAAEREGRRKDLAEPPGWVSWAPQPPPRTPKPEWMVCTWALCLPTRRLAPPAAVSSCLSAQPLTAEAARPPSDPRVRVCVRVCLPEVSRGIPGK